MDARVQRAVAAGETLTRPVEDQVYGDRTGEITDPFGYRWTLSTHGKDVSPEQMQRGAAVIVPGGWRAPIEPGGPRALGQWSVERLAPTRDV